MLVRCLPLSAEYKQRMMEQEQFYERLRTPQGLRELHLSVKKVAKSFWELKREFQSIRRIDV